MNEMKKSIETILLQKIPNRDMEIQENHENKENKVVETQSHHIWREKILNLKIMIIHYSKIHFIRASS
jgi:hypothetical protein